MYFNFVRYKMESEPEDEDDVIRDFLDEDGIRDILDTLATDFECPSESEASDLGSDDELDRALREKEMYAIDTLSLDRVPNEARQCLVPPEQLQRGKMSIATSEDNITLVRWMDRRAVHTLSTYAGSQPEDTAQRWDRTKKRENLNQSPICDSTI